MSAHIVKVKAVLVYFPGFLPSPFPPSTLFFFVCMRVRIQKNWCFSTLLSPVRSRVRARNVNSGCRTRRRRCSLIGTFDLLRSRGAHNWRGALLRGISLMRSARRGVGSERGGRPWEGGGGSREREVPIWDFMFSSSPHSLQIKVAVAKVTWQRKGKYLAAFRLFLCSELRSQRHR